jgi:hypothetical protein
VLEGLRGEDSIAASLYCCWFQGTRHPPTALRRVLPA